MKNSFFTLQDFTLNNYKLDKDSIKSINIFNDISSIGMSITIIYNDITDVKNKMPLRGGEELDFLVQDANKTKIKKTFVLIKVIEDNTVKEEHTNNLVMKFITKESYYLGINRLYKSYNNTVTNIISSILTVTNTIPYTKSNQVIIPGWSKIKAIQYLLNRTPEYICFENNDGFILDPTSSLLKTSDRTFKFKSNNSFHADLVLDYKEIENINPINEGYENIYKRRYTSYNPNSKTISKTEKTIESEQSDLITLGSGKNYSEDIFSSIETREIVVPYYNSYKETKNISKDLYNIKYQILVRGDLSLDIGTCVNLNVKDKFNTNINPNTNGLYLITKVAHYLNAKDFYTKLTIEKNSYFKGTNNSDSITDNVVL